MSATAAADCSRVHKRLSAWCGQVQCGPASRSSDRTAAPRLESATSRRGKSRAAATSPPSRRSAGFHARRRQTVSTRSAEARRSPISTDAATTTRPITRLIRPTLNKLAQLASRRERPLLEELPDRILQDGGRVLGSGLAVEMHHQRERPIVVQLARPVDDEGLGVGVEVALAEWRRVHRVEELVQLADVDFDDLAAGGSGSPTPRSAGWCSPSDIDDTSGPPNRKIFSS